MLKLKTSRKSSTVFETGCAEAHDAFTHFSSKLSFETDPSDVHTDMANGEKGFILIDARDPQAYAREHIIGAVNLWHREVTADTVARLPKGKLFVTYCSGVACNGSTKCAMKLAQLGCNVKEMIGGIEFWKAEGYPVTVASS